MRKGTISNEPSDTEPPPLPGDTGQATETHRSGRMVHRKPRPGGPGPRMADIARDLQKPVAGLYKSLERTRDALRSCIEQYLCQGGFDAGQRVG